MKSESETHEIAKQLADAYVYKKAWEDAVFKFIPMTFILSIASLLIGIAIGYILFSN